MLVAGKFLLSEGVRGESPRDQIVVSYCPLILFTILLTLLHTLLPIVVRSVPVFRT